MHGYQLVNQNKYELHRTHATRYLEHAILTINNHPSAEKFYLLITVWFVLQESDCWSKNYYYREFEQLCVILFGFDSTDITWDRIHYRLMPGLDEDILFAAPSLLGPIYRYIAETKRLAPEPILSLRYARVAISCIQYLFRRGANTQEQLLAWAAKSKQSPWLRRQRMRFTATRRHEENIIFGCTYSFPQSLRRLLQILYPEKIQSKEFYWVQRKFYPWTLNLFYLTLHKSRKSDELIRALSKSFIPLSASIFFPRRIKRVRKAIDAYLHKVSRRACCNPRSDQCISIVLTVRSITHENIWKAPS